MLVTMNKVIFVTVAILMMFLVNSKCDQDCIGWNEKIRICGSKLSDVMKEVCQGKYFDPTSPNVHRTRTTRRIGIVDECCFSWCTPIFLRSHYCMDSGTFKEGDDPRPCIKMPSKKDDGDFARKLQNIQAKRGPYEWGV